MKPIFSQYVRGAVSADYRRLLGAAPPSPIRVHVVINWAKHKFTLHYSLKFTKFRFIADSQATNTRARGGGW